MSTTRPRLPAAERRASLLACACETFSHGSYRGTTTAEIARVAGVTEPILYRHFDSKRDLYLACIADTWERVHALWERAIANEPDPAEWVSAMGRAVLESKELKAVLSSLWVQALAEASEDAEIRTYMQAHLLEVHGFVADVIARAQERGGIPRERDAAAEAWIFLAVGLLEFVGRRLGGLVAEDFPRIVTSRRRWLIGRD